MGEVHDQNTLAFTPCLLARVLGCRDFRVEVDAHKLYLEIMRGTQVEQISLIAISSVDLKRGLFWNSVSLMYGSPNGPHTTKVGGLSGHSAKRLASMTDLLRSWNTQSACVVRAIGLRLDSLLSGKNYIARRDLVRAMAGANGIEHEVLADIRKARALDISNVLDLDLEQVGLFFDAGRIEQARVEANLRVVKQAKEDLRGFFSTVEKMPLSEEQQDATLIDEDLNLVIAAAGSGKTSTIVSKVAHWVASGRYQPEEVMALAFAGDAAKELRARIHTMQERICPDTAPITVSTFHSFGNGIVRQVLGKKLNVCKDPPNVVHEVVQALLREDHAFLRDWVSFIAIFLRPMKARTEFDSLEAYNAHLRKFTANRNDLRTLKGDLVASLEELAISNFLFLNGVRYEYERPYEHDTSDAEHRQYAPDFFYPDVSLYHEHFGVDANGRPAPFLDSDYLEGILWKRKIHTQYRTKLMETTSAMFTNGTILERLTSMLRQQGLVLTPISGVELESALAKIKGLSAGPEKLMASFLAHLKTNGLTPEQVAERLGRKADERAALFLQVMSRVYKAYGDHLAKYGLVDFSDMILLATEYVRTGKAKTSIKALVVDEFQDISSARVSLVNAILRLSPDSRLLAVGDDWQAIYRFAGSDVALMTHFQDYFGQPAITRLTKTYRCNQGIASLAAAFVQRNPAQYQKMVVAHDDRTDGCVDILRISRGGHAQVIGDILGNIASQTPRAKVFFLARYRSEGERLPIEVWRAKFRGVLDISFKTMHEAKGLEADHVFILGMNAGGFPSEIADDPLLALAMPRPESFEHAEERRLLYVALTCARHHVYLVADKGKESCFIREIEALLGVDNSLSADGSVTGVRKVPCPQCGKGILLDRQGKHGAFKGCSKYPACRYTTAARVA